MKKKRLASLLVVAPLALLAACSSTPTLELNQNWFSNTGRKEIPDDFEETLEYAVSFEQTASGSFHVDFPGGGTYKTTFTSGSHDGQKTYVYTTELKIQIKFSLNDASTETFENTITTRVEFLDITKDLKPISSTRTAHVNAPLYNPSSPPSSLEAAYGTYNYKTDIDYDLDHKKAKFTITDLTSEATAEKAESKTIKLNSKGFYFDNDQFFPMLRAAELSSSMSLYSIDPTTITLEKLAVKTGPDNADAWKQSVKYAGDAEPVERTYNVTTIGLGYSKKNPGGTHKYTLARRSDNAETNVSRNVVLEYSYPVIYSHGTLTYKLVAASFYN